LDFSLQIITLSFPCLRRSDFCQRTVRRQLDTTLYRDHSQSRKVLGQALREAHADLFTIKAEPTDSDRALIEGKFKSAHNTSDRVGKLMATTFFSLLPLADLKSTPQVVTPEVKPDVKDKSDSDDRRIERHSPAPRPTLHYNIQIHLPPTKDVEVFNAIFKSLREHLLD
jgi:hypothetical protein